MVWYEFLLFQCPGTCQRPESMLLLGVGYLGLFGLWLMERFCSVQECLLRRGGKRRAEQEKQMLAFRGVLLSVSKERRQEKKGKATTEVCNMAAVVYLSHTAVILARRSSSHPCGTGLESPNLSAALPNVVTCGGSRPQIAPVVMTVYMPCSR